ncbi:MULTISPECIES: efflux RND transporter periplasmic adaptor subunit [unclassified Acidovorax]|uniref:efflux RND transporter periplasmic adaptor subunit n=1 Tax=unclassified Acidovorax TaxID=2684926 RepID=UPI001C4839AE|nr:MULTISPECIES: efflux RND transporter periplasmic adaptor subunit [unclassified Acidovorax]MBV7431467.1 efflux RND transporter periplasmic adaptor subunit [Acidovorax sp. sif0732]MBV7452684.1 efflux RND transporter periplasmic adaptor subunit [Acidovorax sp. sif0715]
MPTPRDASAIPSFRASTTHKAISLVAATAAAVLLAACGKSDGQAPAGGQQMAPVEVGVVTATPGDVGLITELPGRVEASRVAQVRARAAGILQQRLFKEGSDVKAGQPLFRIDAAPYAAASESARASLAKAQANLAQASAQVERYRPLVSANAISKQDFVNAEAAEKQAQADVAAARASVRTADINLGYASVTSPISGRIGRALVTEGALVGQGEATALAVVQQIDPVYVNFTQSASDVFQLRRAMESGQFKRAGGTEAASVKLVLGDGSEYAQTGKLLFTDLSVDATTGQVTLRAEVPNPKGELLPGLYLRVRIEQAQASNAITLPQQAVTRTQQGDTVSVVGEDGKVSQRPIKVSAAQNNRWVVLDGLKAGEKVMVDGFQKLQMLPPGTPVKPVPWQAPGAPSAAPSSPAAAAAPAAPAASAASSSKP